MSIPRAEYPNPIFERQNWLNLNGEWDFEFDFGMSGEERGMDKGVGFTKNIIVPFCPESSLSNVGYKDFMNCVWYKRTFEIPKEQLNKRTVLHFGAVDYTAVIFVNGVRVGSHSGGYTHFEFDITSYVKGGENLLVVEAQDLTRSGAQPRGKQSDRYNSYGCSYTRTTGIWQTVWLEFVPYEYLKDIKFYPDVKNNLVGIEAFTVGEGEFSVTVSYEGRKMGKGEAISEGGQINICVPLKESHLWELGQGRLYDVEISYGSDTVSSYFGLRSVSLKGQKFMLNGNPVFQRMVLDQGFYPDGIYTAKDEADLKKDIELSMSMGFNGARLHQKVFEPRFLYYCDKLGYMVWEEYGNWGVDMGDHETHYIYASEWEEAVSRDFNHPSIIGWCPFNEIKTNKQGAQPLPSIVEGIYKQTKLMDRTRPCIGSSGWYNIVTDIYDVHNYDQNPESLKETYETLEEGKLKDNWAKYMQYKGEPLFVSEYGGIRWDLDGGAQGWGYGAAPTSKDEFLKRYEGLTNVLLDNEHIMGFCYTQLYDVEQEINGLYTYDRRAKFEPCKISEINKRKAAIEE
ncbi:MAG: glycoside hydrolase family 2 TIM barrel-domain containing protein [Bacillota bacterium]|nr:glycoside hydrolase family 2 TIM barrel-domain containing protein [Bacillota bacterium]